MSENSHNEATNARKNASGVSLQMSNVNVESLDTGEPDSAQGAYQIRPQLSDKFKPQVVKELIHNVLHDILASKKYSVEDANKWSKNIADTIRNKVKDLKYPQYKYVVNVVLGEARGAGIKMGTRCIWDAEADSYAHGNFMNESMFCVACVYAVFYY